TPQQTTPCAHAKRAKHPSSDEGANEASDDIPNDPVARTSHHYRGQEASDQSHDQPPNQAFQRDVCKHQGCYGHRHTLLFSRPCMLALLSARNGQEGRFMLALLTLHVITAWHAGSRFWRSPRAYVTRARSQRS